MKGRSMAIAVEEVFLGEISDALQSCSRISKKMEEKNVQLIYLEDRVKE